MKNLIGLFFVISFWLFACDKRKERNDNLVCKTTYWENGRIRAEGCFSHDSIREGLFKKYFRSGQLEFEINYHNNKEDGHWINYFENGKKHFVFHYKNGVRLGADVEYFENGTIKRYLVHNLKGDSAFEIDYLEDGSIKDVIGAAVTDYSVNKDTLDVGDVLKIDFIVAKPKKSKVRFLFYEDSTTKRNSRYLEVNDYEDYGTVTYQKVLDQKGMMNWGGTYTITFDNGKEKEVKFKFVGFSTVR